MITTNNNDTAVKMSKTLHTAEGLMNDGDSQDVDSQIISAKVYEQMRWAAGIPTSSSPSLTNANRERAPEFSQALEEPLTHENVESQPLEAPLVCDTQQQPPADASTQQKQQADANKHPHESNTSLLPPPTTRQSILKRQGLPPGWRLGLDSNKKPALYDQNNIIQMSAHTNSSDSTTQENPQWLYDQHNQSWGLGAEEQTSQASALPEAEPSTLASVPPRSLHDDDTGHIDLMKAFTRGENAEDYSQDQSYAAGIDDAEEAETQVAHPETPAIVNPFERSYQEDTVLATSQLFKETQVTPMLQAPTSAASQRPSPDVYSSDHLVSPEKPANSSPSARGSFNSRASLPRHRAPKHHYVSRKDEGERRKATVASSPDRSQSSDGFDDHSQEVRRRVEQRKRNAMMTLSRVSAPARSSSGFKGHSDEIVPVEKPASKKPLVTYDDDETESDEEDIPGPSADVAVPGSTEAPVTLGRRRSLAEEYIAQTNGTDARDTQQDDMVLDSQALPSHHNSSSAVQEELPGLDAGSETEDAPSQRSLSPAPAMSARNPDPLGETPLNALNTPKPKGSSYQDDVVLETSPYKIRPLGDIDEDSSPVDDDSALLNGIGFSQDEDFQKILSQPSLPPPRLQRTPVTRISKSQSDVIGSKAGEPRLASQSLSTSSLRAPADSAQPVLEVGATPKTTVPADVPVVSTGPTVLDTPQASNHSEGAAVNDVAGTTTVQSPTADLAPNQDTEPVTPHTEEPSRVTKKRKNIESEPRPSKKSKNSTSTSIGTKFSAPPSDASLVEPDLRVGIAAETGDNLQSALGATDTGSKKSTAPKAPASSKANIPSIQSSALSELSDGVDIPTPEAFKGEGEDLNISNAEDITETSIDPKGPLQSLKRKRATDTPPSSLTPTAKKSKAPAKAAKTVANTRVSQGRAKATPKAVKALRGTPASGTRSSSRRAAASGGAASNGTPSNSVPRGSASSNRSTSRLSTAPSNPGNDGVLPSTPVRGKGKTKESGRDEAEHGIFHNMAFAVSYVKHPKQKEDVLSKIYEEGGLILEPGFDTLFTVDELPVTPSRSRRAADANSPKDLEIIKPNTDADDITFACVIADEHSRKSKYMQALSLDLPCLHGNWILDCVDQQRIVDWAPYLLCAGQPDMFRGAVRSRMLAPYLAQSANFSEHFESDDRMKLLRGKKVLAVVGTTKTMVDKRKAYVFLVQALGAEKVGTVPTIEAARNVLETEAGRQNWDWVYVDRNEELGHRVFESPRRKKSKKRKKGDNDADDADEPEAAEPDKFTVKVIGDQFIVQSLILGRLLDEGSSRAYNDRVEEPEDEEAAAAANEEEDEAGEAEEDEADELS